MSDLLTQLDNEIQLCGNIKIIDLKIFVLKSQISNLNSQAESYDRITKSLGNLINYSDSAIEKIDNLITELENKKF